MPESAGITKQLMPTMPAAVADPVRLSKVVRLLKLADMTVLVLVFILSKPNDEVRQ